jgi:hypothetical protein
MTMKVLVSIFGTLVALGVGLGITAVCFLLLRFAVRRANGVVSDVDRAYRNLWIAGPAVWAAASLALILYQIWRASWIRSRQFEIITNTAPYFGATVGLTWVCCVLLLVVLYFVKLRQFFSSGTTLAGSLSLVFLHGFFFLILAAPLYIVSYFFTGGIE